MGVRISTTPLFPPLLSPNLAHSPPVRSRRIWSNQRMVLRFCQYCVRNHLKQLGVGCALPQRASQVDFSVSQQAGLEVAVRRKPEAVAVPAEMSGQGGNQRLQLHYMYQPQLTPNIRNPPLISVNLLSEQVLVL